MRIYLEQKLDRYMIIKNKPEYSGCSTEACETIYWYKCGSVRIGFTKKEVRKLFDEIAYLDYIRKRKGDRT